MMKISKDTVVLGCDISYWQGAVDFDKMYNAGIRQLIIRAGYGTSTVDKNFVTYINGAIKAGIPLGIYWFIYAKNESEAKKNAEKCMEIIKPYKSKIVCGVWADWEYDSDKKAGYPSLDMRNKIVQKFLDTLEDGGYEVGIYSNQDYIKSGKFKADMIAKYPLWFAKYSTPIGSYANKGKDGTPYLWQYTSKGKGSTFGVASTYIDLNKGYFTVSAPSTSNVVDKVTTSPTKIEAKDNPYTEPTRIITKKTTLMRGDDVKWVQWHLWRFGLLLDSKGLPDAKEIDGIFGTKSYTALISAQKKLGLTADGKCGPKTIAMFKKV